MNEEERNMENLVKKFNELTQELYEQGLTPGSEPFENRMKAIAQIWNILKEDEKFKEEILSSNRKFDIEEEKATTERIEARNKGKSEIKGKIIGGVISVVGSLLCIGFTGWLEQSKILSQRQWNFVNWHRPRT